MRLASVFIAGLLGALIASAQARDYKVGAIDVVDPWSRATPKGTSVAAGYMKITNTGTVPDRLVAGSSDVAPTFEVHEMTMQDGIAKMRPVIGGFEIKPGQTVELKPGGTHVMLVDLKKPLNKDDHFKATLVFEKAGMAEVEFDVLPIGATPSREPAGKQTHHH